MKENTGIHIIIPYFGRLPELSKLFFISAGYNKHVRFLFFTDQKKPVGLPENIRYIRFSLNDFNKLVGKKLGIDVKVLYPYKLCDYKPMYGKIFEDYLTETQFWGYCDLDMIFGSISKIITAADMNNYDIITSRKDSLAGNFTLFKNTEELKNLYLKSDCWQEILKNNLRVHSFPERFKIEGRPASNNFIARLKCYFSKPVFSSTQFPDINSILTKIPEIKVYYGNFMLSDMMLKNQQTENWQIKWDKGELTDLADEKQILYFHFYFLKKHAHYQIEIRKPDKEIQSILISQDGIIVE